MFLQLVSLCCHLRRGTRCRQGFFCKHGMPVVVWRRKKLDPNFSSNLCEANMPVQSWASVFDPWAVSLITGWHWSYLASGAVPARSSAITRAFNKARLVCWSWISSLWLYAAFDDDDGGDGDGDDDNFIDVPHQALRCVMCQCRRVGWPCCQHFPRFLTRWQEGGRSVWGLGRKQ